MSTYMIVCGHGNMICDGIPNQGQAQEIAQRKANARQESVWIHGPDIGEEGFEVEPEPTLRTYEYSIFDGDPDASGPNELKTAHIEAESDDDAIEQVKVELESYALGLSTDQGYEVGDLIYALLTLSDESREKLSHALTAEDLGINATSSVDDVVAALKPIIEPRSVEGDRICVSVVDDEDDDDNDDNETLADIRAAVEPLGWEADWTGNSNTESNGTTYSDIVIKPAQ